MDELQTLRTRCGEMAAEIERLNGVIVDLKQQITATDISWQNAKVDSERLELAESMIGANGIKPWAIILPEKNYRGWLSRVNVKF